MATLEERVDALTDAVNELGYAIAALASAGNPDEPPKTNAGRRAQRHLDRAAQSLSDAKAT